jgi:hypothetical protein
VASEIPSSRIEAAELQILEGSAVGLRGEAEAVLVTALRQPAVMIIRVEVADGAPEIPEKPLGRR